jgi:hypothetical protein
MTTPMDTSPAVALLPSHSRCPPFFLTTLIIANELAGPAAALAKFARNCNRHGHV